MNTKYPVTLKEEQRQHLEKLTSSGKVPARQMKRAQILLKSDSQTNWSYEQIMEAFDVSANTIAAVRKVSVEQGLDAALQRKKPAREYEHILDSEGEAYLIALACSAPPKGRENMVPESQLPNYLRAWQALASLANYCGTGENASIGMGRTSTVSSFGSYRNNE